MKTRATQVPPNSIGSSHIISHQRSKVNTPYVFSRTTLITDIKKNARAANIPPGSAEIFATRTADHVEKWLASRTRITESDLNRIIIQKLTTFSPDLAFFYKNNGKII